MEPGDDPTTDAADLAETILAEVSRQEQDWTAVAELARRLADLADAARPE